MARLGRCRTMSQSPTPPPLSGIYSNKPDGSHSRSVPNPQRGLVTRWPCDGGGRPEPVILAGACAPPQGWPRLVIGNASHLVYTTCENRANEELGERDGGDSVCIQSVAAVRPRGCVFFQGFHRRLRLACDGLQASGSSTARFYSRARPRLHLSGRHALCIRASFAVSDSTDSHMLRAISRSPMIAASAPCASR